MGARNVSVEALRELLRQAGEVEHLAATRPGQTHRRRQALLRWSCGLAAAVGFAVLWAAPRPAPPEVRPAHRPARPAVAVSTGRHEPAAVAAVLALFRIWSDECDCPAWTVYTWQEQTGRLVSAPAVEWLAAGDEPVPIDPTIVLAIAHDARDLPRTERQRRALLRCLDAGSPLVDLDVTCAPSVVSSCLPETVTVVARPIEIR